MTQYMLLIYADESSYADVSPEAWAQMSAQQGTFVREMVARGGVIHSGEGLLPTATATTVRSNGNGHLVTDGPFAETKEALGGFYVVEAADLDQALEFAKLCPSYGGAVEVRPVMERTGMGAPVGYTPTTADLTDARRAVAEAHRREWATLLAATVRLVGRLDVAEECVQDAYVAALEAWTRDGVPDNPAAWLTTVSRRRALDRLRRDQVRNRPWALLPGSDGAGADSAVDARLDLVFLCAHPALGPEARVALTLRMVCGLSTAEIARAFLVPEATMAARLTRAKKKIAAARIPFRTPPPEDWADRLDGVLTVVHLVLTAGHVASVGAELTRPELVDQARDLAALLHHLMPHEREVLGLRALLELTDARRASRTDTDGRLVLLEDQDRSRWDRAAITRGCALLRTALTRGRPAPPGRFALQAAIAAVHAEAPTWADTDWGQIHELYNVLLRVWPSPVVALNRAVARAMVDSPEAGLAEVDALAADGSLAGYPYLPAARATMLERLGRGEEARAAYQDAAALAPNEIERQSLTARAEAVALALP